MTDKYKPEYRTSWALVIGIDNYKDPSIPPLATAVKGAQAVATILSKELDFPEENVILLENEKATQRAIRRAFTDPFGRATKVSVDDRVLVYFGGHGLTFDTAEGEIGCIAPYDTEAEFLDTTIPMDELTRLANRSHAKHVLFLLDACFSGYATVRQSDTGIIRQIHSYLTRPVRQVITAGARDQAVSDLWGPDQHSLFTGFVLEGLRGSAPAPGGILRAFHLAGYLQDQIGQHSRSHQTPQYAALMGSGGGDFIFQVREIGDLPIWLTDAVESDDPAQRLFAVGQLRMLAENRSADDNAPVLAQLEELTTDSDSMVRASAKGALRELMPDTKVAPITRSDLLATHLMPDQDSDDNEQDILAVLTFTDGPAKGGQFEILKAVTTIGRTPDSDLVVWDDNISREHAQIEILGDELWLTDLGSTNGTYVNGNRISEPNPHTPSDRVGLGRSVFFVSFAAEAAEIDARTPTAVAGMDVIAKLSQKDEPPPGKLTKPSPKVEEKSRLITEDNIAALGATRRIEEHMGEINDLAWSPDGLHLVTVSADGQGIVWNLKTGASDQVLEGHSQAVTAAGWSPDGRYIATGSEDTTIMLWNAENGQHIRTLEAHTVGVLCVAWSPDNKWLASGGRENQVIVWNTNLGTVKHRMEGHTGLIFDLEWGHDEHHLLSASGDSRLIIWDALSAKNLYTLRRHQSPVESAAWSPDGQWVASTGGSLIIWNARSGASRREIKIDAHHVSWSSDGLWLACAVHGEIVLFEAKSGRQVQTLKGHTKDISALAWSPDMTRLASVSRDRTIMIWEVHE